MLFYHALKMLSYFSGNSVAEAFTNAFVHAKVAEIQAQIEECYNCTCTSSGLVCTLLPGASNLSFCTRQPGMYQHCVMKSILDFLFLYFQQLLGQLNLQLMCQ